MRDFVRKGVRVVLIGAATFGLAFGLLGPLVEDDVEVSVVAAVTVVGIVISYELMKTARRSGRLAWHRVPPLWGGHPVEVSPDLPDSVWEWEALVGAARSDERARDRLLRRMAPLARPGSASFEAIRSASDVDFDRELQRFIEESRRG